MRYGVLGTGMVGRALCTRLAGLGHDVVMGSRDATNPAALEWSAQQANPVAIATFADAAAHAEVVDQRHRWGCHPRRADARRHPAPHRQDPRSTSRTRSTGDSGSPPSLTVANTDSIGEQIQAAHPGALVVKTLNTVTADVMVDPPSYPVITSCSSPVRTPAPRPRSPRCWGSSAGRPSGCSISAASVTARATEMYLPLWIALYGVAGGHFFNISLNRG